jgi:hypothetical protein
MLAKVGINLDIWIENNKAKCKKQRYPRAKICKIWENSRYSEMDQESWRNATK